MIGKYQKDIETSLNGFTLAKSGTIWALKWEKIQEGYRWWNTEIQELAPPYTHQKKKKSSKVCQNQLYHNFEKNQRYSAIKQILNQENGNF